MATLTIPDDLYQRLLDEADRTGRAVDDVLRDTIERAMSPREDTIQRLRTALSDALESTASTQSWMSMDDRQPAVNHATLRASMPSLDRPMSETVRVERDERG